MTPRQAERSADLFTVAVVASVAIALAGLTWRLIAGVSANAPPLVVATVPHADVDITPIIALAPFGTGGTGAPIPTSLPLELRGVIMSIPSSASSALIAPAGGAPIAYTIGLPIPGGGTLETIGIDNIVFAIGGHREILAFPKAGGTPSAPASNLAPAGATAPPPAGATLPAATPAVGSAFTQSPQSILEGLAAVPTANGYRVGEAMAATYRTTGLQPGDVIEQVNGTRLGNPAVDQQLLATAVRSGTVRVDVARGDRRMTLSFPVR